MKSIDLYTNLLQDSLPSKKIIGQQGDYSYFLPCKILFGAGVADKIGEEAKKLGCTKALIITDKGIVNSGLVNIVTDTLKNSGIDSVVYDGVTANPTIDSVNDAYFNIKKVNPDGIVALGGGSAIDTAKVAALRVTNDVPLEKALRGEPITIPRNIPLIAVETCSGTSAEVTLFAPVQDAKTQDKLGYGTPLLIPDVAICDPLFTLSVPSSITAYTGIDCLSHGIESYVTKHAWPITEVLALGAIKLVFDNLREAVFNGNNVQAREGMLMANLMVGMAFPYSGAGMVHGCGEPLSGVYNMAHGLTMGLVMPYVEKFNMPSNYSKFKEIARAAGENIEGLSEREAAEKAIVALVKLNKDVGIPDSLEEAGVKKEDLPKLIGKASNHGCMSVNPILMTKKDLENVFHQAFSGVLKDIV